MRVQHLFDICARLYMPTHHLEFYINFFYVLVIFSVSCCVVCGIFSCGKHIHKRLCLSARLSVCLSLCEHVSTPIILVFHQMVRNTYCLWFPNFQGHMSNFEVTQAKNFKFRVFWHFLENALGKGLECGMLMYSDHLIRFWSRSVDLSNFGGILIQWNSSILWFPYFLENAWQ